jgi:titin
MWFRRFRSWLARSSRPVTASRRRSPFKPTIEVLEQRDVPAVFTVTNTGEFGLGTLDDAILLARFHNDAPGEVDRIEFNLAGAGVHTFSLQHRLPPITKAVIIDGFTQPGAHANTLAVGDNSVHLIEINGANAGPGADGFDIEASGVTIRGLVINGFQKDPTTGNGGNGVVVQGGSNNFIEDNFIGTNAAGTAAISNNNDGVLLSGGANNNVIRGNVISGNGSDGVEGKQIVAGNVIAGNIIGLDATGTQALANRQFGVDLEDALGNNIGGPTAADRNVISGNGDTGVFIGGTGSIANLIQGNFIGTDVTGTRALGNTGGVLLNGPANTEILGNVISGNNGQGISTFLLPTNGIQIQGNKIGTNAAGTADLGNAENGVVIGGGATNVQIGGANPGEGNLISGNFQSGVFISDKTTSQVTLLGNLIGTDVTGTLALGNGTDGVEVEGGPTQVTIGGAGAGRNVISGNALNGVFIQQSAGTVVVNDFIGTNAAGTAALANGLSGAFVEDSDGVQIKGNVLSGNGRDGVESQGLNNQALIVGNKIGTNAAGTAALGNAANGIELSQGDVIVIGGTAAGDGNVISGNGHDGILAGLDTIFSSIEGNFIGTDVTGLHALGNGGDGVAFAASSGNHVGDDTTAGAGNTIAFNGGAGVAIDSGGQNSILGNSIFANGGGGIVRGATRLQPAPVLESVTAGPGGTFVIHGTVTSTPDVSIHVEFFANAVADPSGFGQGQTPLGSLEATTDANGTFRFDRIEAVPAGTFVTATVTVPDGADVTTSAFSNALRVGGQADPPPPAPTPAPARAFVVSLVVVRIGKKKVLFVVEQFADTGAVKAVFAAPFQPDRFKDIKVIPVTLDGAGVFDLLVFTAVRKGKTHVAFLPA